jgi:hypothetical protein
VRVAASAFANRTELVTVIILTGARRMSGFIKRVHLSAAEQRE